MTSKCFALGVYMDAEGTTPPSPKLYEYWAHPLPANEDSAAAAFRDRYNAPPAWIFESGGNLLVGPVPGHNFQALELSDVSPEFAETTTEDLPY